MRRTLALVTTSVTTLALGLVAPATADPPAPSAPPRSPVAVGHGGAVSSVDPDASAIGLQVLERGGNAVDAAVATAAALGVTEPYSAGIGGGGYFVHYDAATGEVTTIDGRETAPAGIQPDAFIDPATGAPYRFSPDLVTSGVSVGVPGTPATWQEALDRWGSLSLADALKPAAGLAQRGFVVDPTFALQTSENAARFRTFSSTTDLYLADGVPAVGSRLRNPDLARTYRLLGARGTDWFYEGGLAAEIAENVQQPPLSGATDLPVPPGSMTTADLAGYEALVQEPTHVSYRGHDVYGMAPSSSGGTTVGESLNILEQFDLGAMTPVGALHHYLESTALAFADRGKYVGDPAHVDVPIDALLDDTFAKERACALDPAVAATKPVPAGDVTSYDGLCAADATGVPDADTEGLSTTHLTTADRWGNVVSYTLTIEQTGGSGIVVPGRGFILNNELTDFSTIYNETDPNRIQPGKRPRSSMSPTIVLRDGDPVLALGSPGGSTIITTVLQVLLNRLDLGMSLPEAVAAPRASQRNTTAVTAEQAFIDAYGAALGGYGHTLTVAGPPGTSAAEIGAVAAIELGPDGQLTAVAEPTRRGGGSAMVVDPD
ncbi:MULTISPECIES: gamma-glutamyltransferase [unclassified Nocardioides]|uniref:gamma-glutamyltransferase n=1 Tax=unclassified Nocardioides TaxID=2615069 RepID=UPI0006FA0EF2|nr:MULTISPECIES: gamma-glutamyltransferase [unclassified Nocardioides]KRA31209.1 gamma-glutamyltransferase [Nocardioides sp. Root614]KRA87830.1 gamma-glutamyltransferase [Nocardioides sp. Root682]